MASPNRSAMDIDQENNGSHFMDLDQPISESFSDSLRHGAVSPNLLEASVSCGSSFDRPLQRSSGSFVDLGADSRDVYSHTPAFRSANASRSPVKCEVVYSPTYVISPCSHAGSPNLPRSRSCASCQTLPTGLLLKSFSAEASPRSSTDCLATLTSPRREMINASTQTLTTSSTQTLTTSSTQTLTTSSTPTLTTSSTPTLTTLSTQISAISSGSTVNANPFGGPNRPIQDYGFLSTLKEAGSSKKSTRNPFSPKPEKKSTRNPFSPKPEKKSIQDPFSPKPEKKSIQDPFARFPSRSKNVLLSPLGTG